MEIKPTLANVPPSKHLTIAVHPNDVLVDTPAEMAQKLARKAEELRDSGRSYDLGTSGLTPIRGEQDFIDRANTWLDAARKAFV